MKATDWYKDIEGRKVTWINYDKSKTCLAIVTGFDYYLGYTIQIDKDFEHLKKGDYLTCYRGPMSPIENYGKAKLDTEHRKIMATSAKMIRSGYYYCKTINAMIDKTEIGPSPSNETCVFAQ